MKSINYPTMKIHQVLLLSLLLVQPAAPCTMAQSLPAGHESWSADNGNGTFTNPLFYDEFSDPDILRVGNDYYLAGTTMHAVPGIAILHSKDLVNWENISYCSPRFDFPEPRFGLLERQEIYGNGFWAPCIRHHGGKFYVFSNVNGKGLQVFIAEQASGPWRHIDTKVHIHDLSVLFDDDGKVYVVYGYGEVKCTEMKPDMSGVLPETTRTIIPEGNAVGEGHHIYKINGMYYLISTDYMPNGRTLCSRAKSIWGPYESAVIEADETYGYHPGRMSQVRGRVPAGGVTIGISEPDVQATGCANAHQGGIVQLPGGEWWALLMQDFHSIGRTVDLMPVTWTDGWPMIGLSGNPGRAPRTWLKPQTGAQDIVPHAPYRRSDNFDSGRLQRIWQWNHNPDDRFWSLSEHKGALRLHTQPADQLLRARNTLTQRVIGPVSTTTVMLNVKGLRDGDVAGLGNINIPSSGIGISHRDGQTLLRAFDQHTGDSLSQPVSLRRHTIWLRFTGDYDNDEGQYSYSLDGKTYQSLGPKIILGYQLITFQGSRMALFAYNERGMEGGYADFDDFTVDEPLADRSHNIPLGRTIRIRNLATGRYMDALRHGLMHDTRHPDAPTAQFRLIDRGQGKVLLQCADGRYVYIAGMGLPGDVRLTTNPAQADEFMYQDYLRHEFMLLSMKRHLYVGKSAITGSSYSCDFKGPDPARKNGAVFIWEPAGQE